MEKILLIDDDVELCELVTRYLQREGFVTETVHDGGKGAARALAPDGDFALVILDVMLPTLSGFEVLRRIREKSHLPVLMLTARGEETDRIVGLEIGADDYLPKPFNPRELAARLRAVLRRSTLPQASTPPDKLRAGDVELEPGARIARQNGQIVELTGAEYELLALLVRKAGTVVSREELVRKVLGRPLTAYDRSIDTLVSNLRRKLGHEASGAAGVGRIRAVRGSGYIYTLTAEVPAVENHTTHEDAHP